MNNIDKKLYKLLNLAWIILVIFVGYQIYINAIPVWEKIDKVRYGYLLLGTASGLLFTVPSVWILNDYLKKYSLKNSPAISTFLMFVPAIGKYIPGKIWSTGSFMVHARKFANIPADDVLIFVAYYQIIGVASTLVLLTVAYLFGLESVYSIKYILVALLVIAAFIVLVIQLRRKLKFSQFHLGYLSVTKHVSAMVLQRILKGISLFIFISAFINPVDLMTIVYAFIIAQQAGVLAFFAPAGLGVTEGVYMLVLDPVYGTELAILIALISRVWSVLLDFLLALLGLILKHRYLHEV